MLREFWRLFNCLILVSMVLVLAIHESAEGAGLRDFLPKAGTVLRYEGTRVYRDGTKSKFTRKSYLDWRRERGREYLVRTTKEEEKVALGLQLNKLIVTYEVTATHIAMVFGSATKQGALARLKHRATYDEPWVLLRWPLREGEKWQQNIHVTGEIDGGEPKTGMLNTSAVVVGKEIVDTPAGKFSAWRIEQTYGETQFTAWWASGFIVKWQIDAPRSESGGLVELKEPER